jgi:hypothetical protein
MNQILARFHGQLIKNAQILFKLSLGFSATLPELGYLTSFASYGYVALADELRLTREDEFDGARFLEHVATYTLAIQVDTSLEVLYPSRFESTDEMLRSAARIAHLIRNAFAHNPFAPQWKIPSVCDNKHYVVRNLISLKTSSLNGNYVDRKDYGGPLALLKLSEFVRGKLEHDSATLAVPAE